MGFTIVKLFFQVAKNMGSVVKSLDKAINSMELQKISEVMEKFESQFEDLDVRTSVSIILQIDLNIIEIFLVLVILIPLSKCYQLWNKFVESIRKKSSAIKSTFERFILAVK